MRVLRDGKFTAKVSADSQSQPHSHIWSRHFTRLASHHSSAPLDQFSQAGFKFDECPKPQQFGSLAGISKAPCNVVHAPCGVKFR